MNIAAFTGFLCSDPELKSTATGKMVTSFTIGVQDTEVQDSTDFIDCVAWEAKAEFITKNFKKGMKIEVTGKIKTRMSEYNGNKIKRTELVCKNVGFAERKRKDDSAESTPVPAPPVANYETIDTEDDLPF